MTDYIVQGESLSAVADKIREKTDSSTSLEFPEGFVDAIDGLIDPTVDVGSVTIPDVEITATPTINITSGGLIMAEVNGSGTVTPSVTPGYVSSVEAAEAVATGYTSSQLPAQAAQTITPTTVDQLIPAGKYLTGSQIIKGDANLISTNIADGVTIFGVPGTHQGGVDTHLYWHSVTMQLDEQSSKLYAQAVILSTSSTPVDQTYMDELISNQGAKIVLSGLARGGSGGSGTDLAYVIRRSEQLKTQWDFMGLVYDSAQDIITPVLVTRLYDGVGLTVTDTVNQIF